MHKTPKDLLGKKHVDTYINKIVNFKKIKINFFSILNYGDFWRRSDRKKDCPNKLLINLFDLTKKNIQMSTNLSND